MQCERCLDSRHFSICISICSATIYDNNKKKNNQIVFVPFFPTPQGYSCVDLQNGGMRHSGVYYLQIRGTTYWFLKVFCEQDVADGGWTVSKMQLNNGGTRSGYDTNHCLWSRAMKSIRAIIAYSTSNTMRSAVFSASC